ncbi:unnamed protein product [Parajaminaea phylloscopi]
MPTFPSNSYPSKGSRNGVARFIPSIRKRPFLLFGLPFTITIVGAAYGLSYLTQTRYEYNSTKVSSMSKEEELGMKKGRRKIDLREEYFKLSAGPEGGQEDAWEDWEPKRVPRPAGQEEWGVGPSGSGSYVEQANNTREYQAKRNNGRVQAEGLEPVAAAASSPPSGVKGNRTIITASGERLVIGPDGKPCRACSSRLAFADAMRGAKGGSSSSNSGQGPASSPMMASLGGVATAVAASSSPAAATSSKGLPCPPDVEELGRSTWSFLHSVAAVYPAEPSQEQRSALLSLLTSLPHLYPCGSCADALSEEYRRRETASKASAVASPPPDSMTPQQATASQTTATKFLCSIHNEVNERLGKPKWDCEDLAKLKQRWQDGGARCY